MHSRYTEPDMAHIWSEENKFNTWYDVELAVSKIQAQLSIVPLDVPKTMETLKTQCLSGDYVAKINEIEKTVKHDIIAFLTHLAKILGAPSKYVHYGMTSQDLIDTAQAILLRDSINLIVSRLDDISNSLLNKAIAHKNTACVGRSHGIHAEPMTFGLKLLGHYAAVERCKRNLKIAINNIVTIKCSGAVGTFSIIDPAVEENLSAVLQIPLEPIATQVIPRDRIALLMSHLSIIAGVIERFAVEIRHLQRTEVGEVIESFTKGQKGSSAMPHKKNPISTENLTGLARLVRMALLPAMENIALWHERDISHSSVERVILADTFTHLSFALVRMKDVVDNMQINEQRMRENLDMTGGLPFSQKVLLYLIDKKGYSREEAYKIVQECAHNHEYFKISFRDRKILTDQEIKEIFNPKMYQQNIDYIFRRVVERE